MSVLLYLGCYVGFLLVFATWLAARKGLVFTLAFLALEAALFIGIVALAPYRPYL